MVKEEVEKFYDALSKDYEKTHSSRFVDKIFNYFLFKYLPKKNNLQILDVGGGIGRFAFPLSKKGHLVTLTDISNGIINEAKGLAKDSGLKNIKFLKESVTEMKNQKDNSYDVVLMINGVLGYCKDHQKALEEVHRVLKNKGVLIGTVNNKLIYMATNILLENKDINSFEKAYKTGDRIKKFKIHDFSLKELKEVLTENGFKIVKLLGPTNLLRKWEYELGINENDEEKLLKLQIEFANKREYINNSSDFLFVCEKI